MDIDGLDLYVDPVTASLYIRQNDAPTARQKGFVRNAKKRGVIIHDQTYQDGGWASQVLISKVGKSSEEVENLIEEYIGEAYHGGAGQAYSRRPIRARETDRYVVYHQSGGLDI